MALKVVVAGPKQTGKTTITNFLAEQTTALAISPRYDPTIGVRCSNKTGVNTCNVPGDADVAWCLSRILELEKTFGARSAQLEMWDSSGDHK